MKSTPAIVRPLRVTQGLRIAVGQYSDKGQKEANQDFHGVLIPEEPLLSLKGIAVVIADGISSSAVSRVASESAVKSFLTDFYSTAETWSVKLSAQRVVAATNSWLHALNRRDRLHHDKDKGYICTFSALVLRGSSAHVFHVGDCRVFRLVQNTLEQLTIDHRVVMSSVQSYLGRALGVNPHVEIDYQVHPIAAGDVFVLATDGVYEHVNERAMAEIISAMTDIDAAAQKIVEAALENGSSDNLTIQIIRVEACAEREAVEVLGQNTGLPPPPPLNARQEFDGYRIVRQIHGGSRSHIYLATDSDTGGFVALKVPATDLREDEAYLKRLMMEEWIARRLDSANVLKAPPPSRRRGFLYVATEYVDGQTLAQWMIDQPRPHLETVREIAEQIVRGLRAFHRKEMVHRDLRPANIMIDKTGTVKIIDFGATLVSGVESEMPEGHHEVLGTEQYSAPECLLGAAGTSRADQFSLGVIVYQMLTGRLPYGPDMARARTRTQQRKLRYRSALAINSDVPAWIDEALRRAVHPDPEKRYDALSEFIHDLRHPNPKYVRTSPPPLIERDPVLFWKVAALAFAVSSIVLLIARLAGR